MYPSNSSLNVLPYLQNYGLQDSQQEAIRLYCGVCEDDWNGFPVEVGKLACVSPIYGKTLKSKSVNYVKLSPSTQVVIQDSGAFCDGPGQRLSFSAALKRQITHASRFGYADRLSHRASYDLLIDEKWRYGQRYKSRWSEAEAWEACIETIRAAQFLSAHRGGLPCILSAQGVTPQQYLKCVHSILPYLQAGDMLGLGGWCILGKYPSLLPVFRQMLHLVIPFVGSEGIKQIHLWGCLYAPALGELLYLCDQYGIILSVDSVGPSLRPVFGRWGYSSWADRSYRRPPLSELGRHRKLHTYLVRRWLAWFRTRERRHYRWRPIRGQWSFFENEDEDGAVLSEARKDVYASQHYHAI
jgi:hypothetical protein